MEVRGSGFATIQKRKTHWMRLSNFEVLKPPSHKRKPQNHLGWFLKNRFSVFSPDPLKSEWSGWHAVSFINAWEIQMDSQFATHYIDQPNLPGIEM